MAAEQCESERKEKNEVKTTETSQSIMSSCEKDAKVMAAWLTTGPDAGKHINDSLSAN